MSVKQSYSDHTLSLTPACSFRCPDMVPIGMAVSTVQLMVASQVATHAMTNTRINAANPFPVITSTNQGASGHPTYHEWVWFQLEGQSSCSLGPAQTEC